MAAPDPITRRLTADELRAGYDLAMRLLAGGGLQFVIVDNDGRPIGELTPIEEDRLEVFVGAQTFLDAVAGLPPVDYEDLRADLDRVADQDPTPRD